MRSIFVLPSLLTLSAYASAASVTSTFSDGTIAPFPTAAPSSPLKPQAPAPTEAPSYEQLELRQANVDPADITTATTQMASITSYWIETTLAGGSTTWVEVMYTQTFASIPDQLPTPGSGQIGLGTLTGTVGAVKTKRAEPTTNAAGKMGSWKDTAAAVAVAVGVGAAMI